MHYWSPPGKQSHPLPNNNHGHRHADTSTLSHFTYDTLNPLQKGALPNLAVLRLAHRGFKPAKDKSTLLNVCLSHARSTLTLRPE